MSMEKTRVINKEKIIYVVGEKGVGKTSYVNRLNNGQFTKNYFPTNSQIISNMIINGKNGGDNGNNKHIKIVDVGNIFIRGPIDGLVLMFSLDDIASYKKLKNWVKQFDMLDNKIPVVVVGNKSDRSNARKLEGETYHRKINAPYYEISCKLNKNCNKPLLYLIKKLIN